MADVFLSYQKRDATLAVRMVQLLNGAGLTVWWDQDLTPRESWDRVIEREIADADHVLVLWTPNSVQSEWVRIEANYALNCTPSKLVQARFDAAQVPIAFSMRQYVDLDFAKPDRGPSWDRLLSWLGGSRRVSDPPFKASPPPPPPTPTPSKTAAPSAPPNPLAGLPKKEVWAPIGLRAALPDMLQWQVFWWLMAGSGLWNLYQFLSATGVELDIGVDVLIIMAVFGLPLSVIGWNQPGRLARGIFLLAVIPVCYFLAVTAAIRGLDLVPFGLFGAGVVGSLVGSSLSFAGIWLVGGTIGGSRWLLSMAISTMALAVIGSVGAGYLGYQGAVGKLAFLAIFPPWQIVFAYALSLILTGTPPPWRRKVTR